MHTAECWGGSAHNAPGTAEKGVALVFSVIPAAHTGVDTHAGCVVPDDLVERGRSFS
jgi:hypothetical protein